MNLLKLKADKTAEAIRKLKEEWVADNPENPDLQIQVYFWRGEELAAVVSCPLDRDIGLNAGNLGATGFNADTILLVFEGYHTQLENSPLTGERWVDREMQYVHETVPGAEEKGWVAPALTLTAHERGGDYLLKLMPYHLKGDVVEWDEVHDTYTSSEEDLEAGGTMFAYLQNAMTAPRITDYAAGNEEISDLIGFLGQEQALIHMDLACVKALRDKELINSVCFPVIEGSTRAVQITERLGLDAVQFVERLGPKESDGHLDASTEHQVEGPDEGGLGADQQRGV